MGPSSPREPSKQKRLESVPIQMHRSRVCVIASGAPLRIQLLFVAESSSVPIISTIAAAIHQRAKLARAVAGDVAKLMAKVGLIVATRFGGNFGDRLP